MTPSDLARNLGYPTLADRLSEPGANVERILSLRETECRDCLRSLSREVDALALVREAAKGTEEAKEWLLYLHDAGDLAPWFGENGWCYARVRCRPTTRAAADGERASWKAATCEQFRAIADRMVVLHISDPTPSTSQPEMPKGPGERWEYFGVARPLHGAYVSEYALSGAHGSQWWMCRESDGHRTVMHEEDVGKAWRRLPDVAKDAKKGPVVVRCAGLYLSPDLSLGGPLFVANPAAALHFPDEKKGREELRKLPEMGSLLAGSGRFVHVRPVRWVVRHAVTSAYWCAASEGYGPWQYVDKCAHVFDSKRAAHKAMREAGLKRAEYVLERAPRKGAGK